MICPMRRSKLQTPQAAGSPNSKICFHTRSFRSTHTSLTDDVARRRRPTYVKAQTNNVVATVSVPASRSGCLMVACLSHPDSTVDPYCKAVPF